MDKVFAVLGAGMQGTAAAYDLARFGRPMRILIADSSLAQSEKSAERVNLLAGKRICAPFSVDALDPQSLVDFLGPVDVLLSCVPYWMHPRVARAAIQTQTHMCDLGGNTQVTFETLSLNDDAKRAGVTLIPDTGLAPGLVNSIGKYFLEKLDRVDSIKLFCGVLPQNPVPPFNYKLTFNVEGLVTEYDNQAVVLRNGEIQFVDTLSELEEVEVAGVGSMEAFTTSGGTSTVPYSWQGLVPNYEYKTLRFPGHCDKMRIFKDFGFWNEEVRDVKGVQIRPRDVFCSVFGEQLAKIEDRDQCLVLGIGRGWKNGNRSVMQVDIHDKQCDAADFTSMERTTGFTIAIHAIELATGSLPAGVLRYEEALGGEFVLHEIQRRGVQIKYSEF